MWRHPLNCGTSGLADGRLRNSDHLLYTCIAWVYHASGDDTFACHSFPMASLQVGLKAPGGEPTTEVASCLWEIFISIWKCYKCTHDYVVWKILQIFNNQMCNMPVCKPDVIYPPTICFHCCLSSSHTFCALTFPAPSTISNLVKQIKKDEHMTTFNASQKKKHCARKGPTADNILIVKK